MLLNIPPNTKGLFAPQDIASLHEFRRILNETFKDNLAKGKVDKVLTDNELSTYTTLQENQSILIDFKKLVEVDRAMFQENITNGQRNESALRENINQFTTIGHKRLVRFPLIKASKIRLTVLKTKDPLQLASIGFYKSSKI